MAEPPSQDTDLSKRRKEDTKPQKTTASASPKQTQMRSLKAFSLSKVTVSHMDLHAMLGIMNQTTARRTVNFTERVGALKIINGAMWIHSA